MGEPSEDRPVGFVEIGTVEGHTNIERCELLPGDFDEDFESLGSSDVDRLGVVQDPFGVVESMVHERPYSGWLGSIQRTGSGDSVGSMSRLTTTGC